MKTIDEILEINLLALKDKKEEKNIIAIVKIYKRIIEKVFKYMEENNIKGIKELKEKTNSRHDFYLMFQDMLEEYLWLGKEEIELNEEIIKYVEELKSKNIEYTEDIKMLLDTTIARATNELAYVEKAEKQMLSAIDENRSKSYLYFVLAGIYVDNGELEKAKDLLISSKKVKDLDLPNIIDEYIQTIEDQIKRQEEMDRFYSDEDEEEEYDSFWDD